MERKVYRSLDRPSAFFGVRGRYVTWMAMGLAVDLIVAFIVAAMTVGFIGIVTFIGIGFGLYMYVISAQEKLSDRELDKKLDSRRLASCIRWPKYRTRRLWKL